MNNLLDPRQHGFVPRRSTCSQLLVMTQDYAEFVNGRSPFHAIYFDQRSAFDKVDHGLLLDKMSDIGIHGKTIDWCRDYLSNRTFSVCVDGVLSSPRDVTSGVIQGGSLSPTLYVIFVLDIGRFIPPEVRYLTFADDLKIYCPVRDISERVLLQSAVEGVAKWCLANHMELSPSNTVVLAYSPRAATSPPPTYILDGIVLPIEDSVRDVGVIVTPNLDFGEHVSGVTAFARQLINCIFRCSIVKNPEFYKRLYVSLVVSELLYCCPVWLPYKQKHIRMLESVARYFDRRLHHRCGLPRGSIVVPSVMSILSARDIGTLRRLLDLNLVNHFVEVRKSRSRSACIVRSKGIAHTENVRNIFSWRICSKVAKREIPSLLFL